MTQPRRDIRSSPPLPRSHGRDAPRREIRSSPPLPPATPTKIVAPKKLETIAAAKAAKLRPPLTVEQPSDILRPLPSSGVAEVLNLEANRCNGDCLQPLQELPRLLTRADCLEKRVTAIEGCIGSLLAWLKETKPSQAGPVGRDDLADLHPEDFHWGGKDAALVDQELAARVGMNVQPESPAPPCNVVEAVQRPLKHPDLEGKSSELHAAEGDDCCPPAGRRPRDSSLRRVTPARPAREEEQVRPLRATPRRCASLGRLSAVDVQQTPSKHRDLDGKSPEPHAAEAARPAREQGQMKPLRVTPPRCASAGKLSPSQEAPLRLPLASPAGCMQIMSPGGPSRQSLCLCAALADSLPACTQSCARVEIMRKLMEEVVGKDKIERHLPHALGVLGHGGALGHGRAGAPGEAGMGISYDQEKDILTFSPEIQFVARHYGTDYKDMPDAEFEHPRVAMRDLHDVANVFQKFRTGLNADVVYRPTSLPSEAFTDEHAEWLNALAEDRLHLLLKSMINVGVPESRLTPKIGERAVGPTSFIAFKLGELDGKTLKPYCMM